MRRNPLIVLLALSALLLSTTGSALAQSDEYIAEATGVGYSIEIMGEDAIMGGISGAEVTSDPFAEAHGLGSSLFDDSESEATATSEGDDESQEASASGAVPLPEDLEFLAGVVDSRSYSEARIIDGLPFAHADADGFVLDVGGDLLIDLLVDTILSEIAAELGPVLDEVEDMALDPIIAGLIEACDAAIDEADPVFEGVRDALGAVTEPLPDELDAIRDALDAVDGTLEDPCAMLLSLLTLPPGIGQEDDILTALGEVIRDALAGQNLLLVELAGSESTSAAGADEVFGHAEATGLYVELLSLQVIGDLVDALVGDLIDDYLDALDSAIGMITDEFVEQIPDELEMVAAFLDGLGLSTLLDDPDPVLTVAAGLASANAVFNRDTGEIETDGRAAGVEVCTSLGIAQLLGGDSGCISLEDGDVVDLFEDTPLQSRIAAGAVTESSVERDGLSGEEVIAEVVTLSLIDADGEGPVLEVAAAEASASVYGGIEGEPAALPVTGGSAVPMALLLLAAGLLFARRLRMPAGEHDQG